MSGGGHGIEQVAAKLAIGDMLFRYCRGLDRMDKPLALSVFHREAQCDYGASFTGSGLAFVDWVWEQHRHAARHSHNVTNLRVSVAGDRASSEAYSLMMMRFERDDGVFVLENHGRYLDQWVRHGDMWVITRRRSIDEFQEMRRVDRDSVSVTSSRRDRSDPSYDLDPPLFG